MRERVKPGEKENGDSQNTAGKIKSNILLAKQCNIVGVFVFWLLGVYCSALALIYVYLFETENTTCHAHEVIDNGKRKYINYVCAHGGFKLFAFALHSANYFACF